MLERLARRSCSLPIFPGMTPEEIERVATAVAGFVPDPAPLAAAC